MAIVRVNNLDVYYTSKGKGKTLVLLHGWGGSSQSFAALQELLSSRLEVIALDLPGFGQTSPPPAAWGVEEYAKFLQDFLGELNIKEYYLAGHSFGGRVAIVLASKKPRELQGIILLAAAGITHKQDTKEKTAGVLAHAGKTIFSLPILRYLAKPLRTLLYKLLGRKDYYQATGVMKEIMQKVIAKDLRPYLSKISLPTLIIWGDKDASTPVGDAYIMHQAIKGSTLHIIQGGSHFLPRKFPDTLAEYIKAFLDSL